MRAIAPTGHKALDRTLRALRSALVGLDGTDGRPQARRNARRRVLAAVRGLRAAVDRDWPAIVVRKKVVRLKTLDGRLARLQRQGWCLIPRGQVEASVTAYAVAGVPLRRVADAATHQAFYFVPAWAAAVGPDQPARLRALKGDRAGQRAVLAAAALTQ